MVSRQTLRVFPNSVLESVTRCSGLNIHTKDSVYLDLSAGGTSFAIFGWNHPKVNESMIKQIEKFCHVDYKIWEDPNIEELSNILLRGNPGNLEAVYYSGNSGAEACEAAMKLSYQIHLQNGDENKTWFISRKQSYHGATADALSVGERPNLEIYRKTLSPLRSQISMHHFKKNSLPGETEEMYAARSAKELEDEILRIGPENVAGFIGETIMGGLVGDVPPVGNYWRKIQEVCNKYEIHLILDEVYCGTGTTGKFFAFEYDQISPDIVFFGKTLAAGYGAISALAVNRKILDGLRISDPAARIQHSTTHQAHSLAVAAACAIQSEINTEHFLSEIRRKGDLFRNSINSALSDLDLIFDVRGRGLRFSIEHKVPTEMQADFGLAFEGMMKSKYGMLINAKWHRVSVTPALIITDEQIHRASEAICGTFRSLYKTFIV